MNWLFKRISKFSERQHGFSLVELIVSMFLFSVVVSVVGVAFVNILNIQRRGVGAQKVQETALYMLELIAREIRVSRIEFQDAPDCSATNLTLIHPVNGSVYYYYDPDTNQVVRSARPTPSQPSIPAQLNSSDVVVSRFNFCITGSDPADNQQVRIGIIAQLHNRGQTASDTVFFNIQTMVTSRDITTEYQE